MVVKYILIKIFETPGFNVPIIPGLKELGSFAYLLAIPLEDKDVMIAINIVP